MLCRLGAVAKTAVVAFATFLALGGAKAGTIVDQGLTLYDANTGLEWLDVSATNGRAYSDVLANLGNPADIVYGYRYATSDELDALFIDAGIVGDPCMSVCGAAVGQLIDLLGPTFRTPTYEF